MLLVSFVNCLVSNAFLLSAVSYRIDARVLFVMVIRMRGQRLAIVTSEPTRTSCLLIRNRLIDWQGFFLINLPSSVLRFKIVSCFLVTLVSWSIALLIWFPSRKRFMIWSKAWFAKCLDSLTKGKLFKPLVCLYISWCSVLYSLLKSAIIKLTNLLSTFPFSKHYSPTERGHQRATAGLSWKRFAAAWGVPADIPGHQAN